MINPIHDVQPSKDIGTQMGSRWASRWAPLGLPKRDQARSDHPLFISPKWPAFVLLHGLSKQNPAGSAHLHNTLLEVSYSHTDPNG